MNQSIQDKVFHLLKQDNTYKDIKPYLEKINEKDQKYYEPICYAILAAFKEQDPIQCFFAARMAKEAIEQQNLDFLTVFQDICLQLYEQLAESTLNVKLADKATQFFKMSNGVSNFGTSFFHLILESIYNWAKQFPKKYDGITPTKFYQTYQYLLSKGIKFPQPNYFRTQSQSVNITQNQQQIDILKDLQEQQKLMKDQHDIELAIKDQTYQYELQNKEEQIKFYRNAKQVLDEQVLEYKRNEEKNKKVQQELKNELIKLQQQSFTVVQNSKQYEVQQQNDIQEKRLLQQNTQYLDQQIQDLQKINTNLTERLQKQENGRQIQNDFQLQNQIKELKMELETKTQEIKDKQILRLELEQNINQLKLQLKAKEKLITETTGQKNQDSKQIKLEQNIQDLQRKIQALEDEKNSFLQNQQELQKKYQKLEDQNSKLSQKLLASENKVKELQTQLDQLKEMSPIRTNLSKAQNKQQSSVQFQNFFPPETQIQNTQNLNTHFDFNEDFNALFSKPKPIEIENISQTMFFPYQTSSQYYSNLPIHQHKGQEISFQNFISMLNNLQQKNQYLFQIFHVNRTKNYFIDLPSIQVGIVKQVQKQGEHYQINFKVYFKSEEQSINIQGRFVEYQKMSQYFSSTQKDFNVNLNKKQQYLLEYSINENCTDLSELPVLEINYKQKIQQLFLPMLLFNFIDFSPITKEAFKKYWKQFQIYRSNQFNYNPLTLPYHDSIQHISKNLILINQEKLKPYLQGIDEIKYGAQFRFLSPQLEGLIKFEFIPQKQMIIYVGVKKEKYQQFQFLIAKIINAYHSILQKL